MLRPSAPLIAVLSLVLFIRSAGAQTPPPPALSASEVFAAVSPAIAFIETPTGSGSGVLIDSEHVLTNAHVASPFESVRVRFPDGTDFASVPVVVWDYMTDFAVIRIPAVRIPPARIADAQKLSVGSELYLIGYPGETESNPQPAIMRGLLSRFRSGGPSNLTYVQTDAGATGGNSGGAMVSASGEVIGISEFRFPGTNFTLAASAVQAVERARMLLSQQDPGMLGDRRLSALAGSPGMSLPVMLDHFWAEQAFLLRPFSNGTVDVEVDSTKATLVAFTPSGTTVVRAFFPERGKRSIQFDAEGGQPYVIVVGQIDTGRNTFTVTASEPLLPLRDPDDGRELRPGEPVSGNLDFIGDHDYYYVDLPAGQTVTVTASSVAIDAAVMLDRAGNAGELFARDDDSGGGLLGHDARFTFTARTGGRYILRATDSRDDARGGYSLSVYNSAPPASAPGAHVIVSGSIGRAGPTFFVFGGGTNDDLVVATGCPRMSLGLWAAASTGFVAYIPGADGEQVNAAWNMLFPFGIPANTPLWGWCASQ